MENYCWTDSIAVFYASECFISMIDRYVIVVVAVFFSIRLFVNSHYNMGQFIIIKFYDGYITVNVVVCCFFVFGSVDG